MRQVFILSITLLLQQILRVEGQATLLNEVNHGEFNIGSSRSCASDGGPWITLDQSNNTITNACQFNCQDGWGNFYYMMSLGYQESIQYSFSSFPASYQIQFKLTFLKITSNSWAATDYITFYLGDTTFITLKKEEFYVIDDSFSCSSTQIYYRRHTILIDSNTIDNPRSFKIRGIPTIAGSSRVWGLAQFIVDYAACHSTCRTCNGPNSNQCLSCASPRYLQGTICQTTCDVTYYGNDTSRLCLSCLATNCDECYPNTPAICDVCTTGYFLMSNGSCTTNCGTGMYGDTTTKACETCDTPCLECKDPGTSSKCTVCPNGQYSTDTVNGGTCTNCHTRCTLCTGGLSTQCQACATGFFLDGSTCASTCPTGQWGSSFNNRCENCNILCAACGDGSVTNCTSCRNTGYLSPSSTICTQVCPDGYYANSSNNQCTICNTNCLTCSQTATNCTSCAAGKYLSSNTCNNCHASCQTCTGAGNSNCQSCSSTYYLYLTQCISTCPTQFYENTPTRKCDACDVSCDECTASGNKACVDCADGYYLDVDTCLPCNTRCSLCTDGTKDDCQECKSGFFLSGSSCDTTCPTGEYGDTGTNECQPCDFTCTTCSGSLATNCLSCASDEYLEADKSCQACPTGCLTCTSSTTCQSCDSPSYFLFQQGSSCLATCPNGYYGNTINGICTLCHFSCLTCDGGLDSDCLTCSLPRQLYTDQCKSCNDFIGLKYDPLNPTVCKEICGDGRRITVQPECDDGNTDAGDGCSATCTIEDNFVCSGGTPTAADVCTPLQVSFYAQIQDKQDIFFNTYENQQIKIIIQLDYPLTLTGSMTYKDIVLLEIESTTEFSYTVSENPLNNKQLYVLIDLRANLRKKQISISFEQLYNSITTILNKKGEEKEKLLVQIYDYYTETEREEANFYSRIVLLVIRIQIPFLIFSFFTNLFTYSQIYLDLLQSLYFLKFLGMEMPLACLLTLDSLKDSTTFFFPNPFTKVAYFDQQVYTSDLQLPIDALFLKNFGGNLIVLALIVAVVLIVNLLSSSAFKAFRSIYVTFKDIKRSYIDFSIFINTFLAYFQVLCFYSFLQYSNLQNQAIVQASAALAIMISLVFLIGGYYLMALVYQNFEIIQNTKFDRLVESDSLYPYRVLWQNVDSTESRAQVYIFAVILKKALVPLIIIVFNFNNFIQLSLLEFLSLINIIIILKYRALIKEKFYLPVMVFNEAMFIGFCVFFNFLIDSQTQSDNTRLRNMSIVFFAMMMTTMGVCGIYNILINIFFRLGKSVNQVVPIQKFQSLPKQQKSIKPVPYKTKVHNLLELDVKEKQSEMILVESTNDLALQKKTIHRKNQSEVPSIPMMEVQKINNFLSNVNDLAVSNVKSQDNPSSTRKIIRRSKAQL